MKFKVKTDVDLQKVVGLTNREFARGMKEGLNRTLRFWEASYLPRHFERYAYGAYPAAFPHHKKRGGRPLYITGTLRDRLVNHSNPISGTSNQATMTLRYGRPPRYSAERVESMISAKIREKHIRYAQASREVFDELKTEMERMYEMKSLFLANKMNIPIKQARIIIYSSEGYFEGTKGAFHRMLTVVNSKEQREMGLHMRDFIYERAIAGAFEQARRKVA